MMESVKIFEDTEALEAWEEDRKLLNELIAEVATMFANDKLEFNTNIFTEFCRKGTEFIYILLEIQAQNDIKKLSIVSESIKENMLAGIGLKAQSFSEIRGRIVSGLNLCQIHSEDIQFNDAGPFISDEETAKKRKELTFFLENESQKQLWKLQNEVCSSLNKMESFLKKKKLMSVFKQGNPDNFGEYISFKKSPKIKLTEMEKRFGGGFPSVGGMIASPDFHMLKKIQ